MSDNPNGADFSALLPEDIGLLLAIAQGNDWLRGVLYTIARRGVALRRRYPDRAFQLLQVLSPHPFYKGGQFLFDLLEWEDFIVDGEPPQLNLNSLNTEVLNALNAVLKGLRGYLDGALPREMRFPEQFDPVAFITAEPDLPPIEPGFYLYQDVVLGIFYSIIYRQALCLHMEPDVFEGSQLPLPFEGSSGFTLQSEMFEWLQRLPGTERAYQLQFSSGSLRIGLPAGSKLALLSLSAEESTQLVVQLYDSDEHLLQERSLILTADAQQFPFVVAEAAHLASMTLIATQAVRIHDLCAYRFAV